MNFLKKIIKDNENITRNISVYNPLDKLNSSLTTKRISRAIESIEKLDIALKDWSFFPTDSDDKHEDIQKFKSEKYMHSFISLKESLYSVDDLRNFFNVYIEKYSETEQAKTILLKMKEDENQDKRQLLEQAKRLKILLAERKEARKQLFRCMLSLLNFISGSFLSGAETVE